MCIMVVGPQGRHGEGDDGMTMNYMDTLGDCEECHEVAELHISVDGDRNSAYICAACLAKPYTSPNVD